MNRNMKQWLSDMIAADRKVALPILSFPSVSLLGIPVRELISDSDRQAEGMKLVADRVPTAAAVSLMDQFSSLRAILLPFLVINLVGMIITFAVTGRVTQFFLNREKGEKK